jgi:long-subunit fatty acid transport protein
MKLNIINKKAIPAMIGLLLSSGLFAQTSTLSPYSRFGIGEMLFRGFSHQRGMGGVAYGGTSAGSLNFSNPATYAYDSVMVVEFGLDAEVIKQTQGDLKVQKTNSRLNTLSLGFPVLKNKIGLAFGIVPYSGKGYDINSTENAGIDTLGTTLTSHYKGSGGYTRYFLGLGANITKNLSLGVNADYLFGTVTRQRRAEFSNTLLFNNNYQDDLNISDFYFEMGLHWKQKINDKTTLGIGIVGAPAQAVKAKRTLWWVNYRIGSSGSDILKDTILYQPDVTGTVTLPAYAGIGFNLTSGAKWQAGVDFTYQDWSSYKSFGTTDTLKNSMGISLGGSLTPDITSTSYFNRVVYRAGVYYNQTSLELRGNQLNEYGVSLGVGLPLRKSLQSAVNIAFEFGQRGTTTDNLIKEQYARVVLGLTFNEVWFQKRKYD